jgi:hypothetical protein
MMGTILFLLFLDYLPYIAIGFFLVCMMDNNSDASDVSDREL